jgi:isoleucyl-tRNA synthetase
MLRCSIFLPWRLDSLLNRVYCALQQMLHCTNRSTTMNLNDNLKTLNELTNNSVERMTALGELNMKIAERMATRQMDLFGHWMEQGTKLMRVATEARGYSDLYKAQVDLTKEASEQMMTESKTSLQFATETRDQYRAWFETTMAEMRKGNDLTQAAAKA